MKPTIKIRMNHKHCTIHFDFLESFPNLPNQNANQNKTFMTECNFKQNFKKTFKFS